MEDVVLRRAGLADAPAIAALHVTVWRIAFRDLAPPEAFAVLDEPLRCARWTQQLAAPGARQVVLVAERGGRLVGMGAAAPPSEALFGVRGEVKSLFLDPEVQGAGLGRRFMGALARHIDGWGYGGLALGVVAGNEPALGFYSALGGREIGRYVDPGPVWRSENIALGWDGLAGLMEGAVS